MLLDFDENYSSIQDVGKIMVDNIDIHIGKKIREARLLARDPGQGPMTQSDLGDAVGVSFQQIQKYENGTNKVSGSRLWQIAEHLNRPISYFFEDLENGKNVPSIPDNAIVTAKMFHELPEGGLKKQVYGLIKSFHSESAGGKIGKRASK